MASIFISYRRSDAPGHAGWLYERLAERFGEANVFKDLDSMEPGRRLRGSPQRHARGVATR